MFVLNTIVLIILINSFDGTTEAAPSPLEETTEPSSNIINGTVYTEISVTSGPLADASSDIMITTMASNIESIEAANNMTTTTIDIPTTTAPSIDNSKKLIVSASPPDMSIRCKAQSEIHSNCSNSCPASCEEPTRKPCRNFCWNGCECAPGYVKNHQWQCIPIEDCPKCGPNEHYRNCGSNCEPSCGTYQNLPVYCNNRASCKRGCFCDYGFVRDMEKNGTCVPIGECPQKCGPNEYWDVNGEPCIRSVQDPRPKCLFEPPEPGCVCNTGFVRNGANKQCEPISTIGLNVENRCNANETYSYCDSECARNCFDENKRQMCPTICHRGCFCNEGYRRDSAGHCVLPDDCRTIGANYETPVFSV
ncbi:hypothetical protein BLOT_014201 [Blomia tropicalis]|nr:hypothetical protein BLOT_014201 [Blomia tropicalis]